MKRLISAGLVALGAVSLAVVPAGPASAHLGTHTVSISGHMSITDADWPDGDDHKHVDILKSVTLSGAEPSQTVRFTGCADEVRVVLDVAFSHTATGGLQAATHTRLYEGASCSTTDLDGQSRRTVALPANASASDLWGVNSDGNKVGVLLQMRHSVS